MDSIDDLLVSHFSPAIAPAGLLPRLRRRAPASLADVAERLRIGAGARGITGIALGAGGDDTTPAGRAHARRARQELLEYLAGRRTFFSVPVDLGGLGPFQARVLEAARRIPFGQALSYGALAARVGRPGAARAVGNALGANPVPIVVPCHRVIRSDGTWGNYALGARLKTGLLRLERSTPVLVGCTSTHVVCRRGCGHEQRAREDRKVVFASVADARSVGYRPCGACRPTDRAA